MIGKVTLLLRKGVRSHGACSKFAQHLSGVSVCKEAARCCSLESPKLRIKDHVVVYVSGSWAWLSLVGRLAVLTLLVEGLELQSFSYHLAHFLVAGFVFFLCCRASLSGEFPLPMLIFLFPFLCNLNLCIVAQHKLKGLACCVCSIKLQYVCLHGAIHLFQLEVCGAELGVRGTGVTQHELQQGVGP
eukprot:1154062-Pelagomonas_calceolata.AAC.7